GPAMAAPVVGPHDDRIARSCCRLGPLPVVLGRKHRYRRAVHTGPARLRRRQVGAGLEGPGQSDDGFETEAARDLDILETGAPRRWRLVGEMCAAHADRLAAALASGTGAEGDLTLDLRDVTFLDTMGLHVI